MSVCVCGGGGGGGGGGVCVCVGGGGGVHMYVFACSHVKFLLQYWCFSFCCTSKYVYSGHICK